MKNIIIKELKITPKKIVLTYHESSVDPVKRELTFEGQREIILQSHIDAIGQSVYAEAMAIYENDKRQQELGFDDEDSGDGEATSEGEDPTNFEQVEEADWSMVRVPVHEDTDIPNFKGMEKDHRDWLINNRYHNSESAEYTGFDFADLREDVKYNYGEKLHHKLTLENAKLKAIALL